MTKSALMAGSYDPITRGHLDVIKRALGIFDRLYVAVGHNVKKTGTFSVEERKKLILESVYDIKDEFQSPSTHATRIGVTSFDGLLTTHAKELGVKHLIRGLRSTPDFTAEFELHGIISTSRYPVELVYLMSPSSLLFVSSSSVRELAYHKAWDELERYVTPSVVTALQSLQI